MLEINPGRKIRYAFLAIALSVFLLWIAIASLPLIALRSDYFTLNTEKEYERFPKILQQLGTYGDMFGMLNCLFSGAAFLGVVYTILLQQRQIRLQDVESRRATRLAGLQNRIAVYESLRHYHQIAYDNAANDILLKARSKGRVKAFAELTSNLLRESEAYVNGTDTNASQEQNFYDHPIRIRHLAHDYFEKEKKMVKEGIPIAQVFPMEELMLELVQEIAALTELAKTIDSVQALLNEAGHAVNASVEPYTLIADQKMTRQEICSYQFDQARFAFSKALDVAGLLSPAMAAAQNATQH